MSPASDDLLKPLRGMYLAQLRERAESVGAFLEHCRNGTLPANERALMAMLAHKLAGSGTTYGFPLVTQSARALEEALQAPSATVAGLILPLESLVQACGQALLMTERGSQDVGKRMEPASWEVASDPVPAGAKTVLIADDDPAIRDLLAYKFRFAGMHVLTAADGEEAYRMIEERHPQLAILDRLMPGLDGMAVLRKMRADAATKAIPVIFLTAMRQERDILEGFRIGVSDYVIKPFLPEEVLARGLRLLETAGGTGMADSGGRQRQ